MGSDFATFYTFALPVFIASGLAFLVGVFIGIWLVVRFCEVTKHGGMYGVAD